MAWSCSLPSHTRFLRSLDILDARESRHQLRCTRSPQMQAVSKLLARPHHLRHLWGLLAGSRLNQVVARERAAAVVDASQAGANPANVAGASGSSEAASSPSLISPHRPSLAERRRQRKNNGPRIEGDTASDSPGREGGFRAKTFSQQAQQNTGAPIRIESGNLSSPPGQFLDEGADLAGGPPRRSFTRVEARTRQFSDAVRFLNKDTGELHFSVLSIDKYGDHLAKYR
jgi:hypothetical protein